MRKVLTVYTFQFLSLSIAKGGGPIGHIVRTAYPLQRHRRFVSQPAAIATLFLSPSRRAFNSTYFQLCRFNSFSTILKAFCYSGEVQKVRTDPFAFTVETPGKIAKAPGLSVHELTRGF